MNLPKTRFRVETRVPIRFSDTDAMGHVNNSRYFSFMEEGRVAYFQALFPEKSGEAQFEIFPFILADIQCSFKYPTHFGDTLVVGLGVTEIKNSSFVMEYELLSGTTGKTVATGRSILVMYDYKTNRPFPVPPELREKIRMLEKA